MTTTEPELTASRLRELLDYEPATGIFRWKVRRPGAKAAPDAQAGYVQISLRSKDIGYRRIRVEGRKYRAYRLAWLWMTGAWPRGQIDHANLKKDDDRWSNLRGAPSQSAQSANRGRPHINKVGFKGVTFEKGKFRAQITRDREWEGAWPRSRADSGSRHNG
jgi:hypothetical protein